jgi:MFS family permease
LRWLVVNGVLGNVSESIVNTYQSIYLLSLGASRSEIGLLSSLSSQSTPLAMVPGASLAARARRYKWLVIVPAVLSRLLLLGLIFLPYLSTRFRLIYLGIALLVLRNLLLNVLNPAWTALLANLVPVEWRGRYFSARNIFMGGAAFLVLLAVGPLIDLLGQPRGYQVALGGAMALGLLSSYAFAKVEEPSPQAIARRRPSWRALWRQVGKHRGFLALSATTALWNLGVQIASPFFLIYLADQVDASASLIGLTSAASTLASIPGQRFFGLLSDSKGPRWVQRVTGFVIPLVPALWGFIGKSWQAFPIQALSGFAWAGYNLASFNLLLEMAPEEDRPTFVALHHVIGGLGMAGGAALGGWVAQTQGYRTLFLLSAAGRLTAALFFAVIIARWRPVKVQKVRERARERARKLPRRRTPPVQEDEGEPSAD